MKMALSLWIVKKTVYRIAGRGNPRPWGRRGRKGPIGGSLELLRPIQKLLTSPRMVDCNTVSIRLGRKGQGPRASGWVRSAVSATCGEATRQ